MLPNRNENSQALKKLPPAKFRNVALPQQAWGVPCSDLSMHMQRTPAFPTSVAPDDGFRSKVRFV